MHAATRTAAQGASGAGAARARNEEDAIRGGQKPINRQARRDRRQQRAWKQDRSRKTKRILPIWEFEPHRSSTCTETAEEPQLDADRGPGPLPIDILPNFPARLSIRTARPSERTTHSAPTPNQKYSLRSLAVSPRSISDRSDIAFIYSNSALK